MIITKMNKRIVVSIGKGILTRRQVAMQVRAAIGKERSEKCETRLAATPSSTRACKAPLSYQVRPYFLGVVFLFCLNHFYRCNN